MTEFESQSLAVARDALFASFLADGLATLALVSSLVAGFLIYGQLNSAKWNTLLTFEQDMNARRGDFYAAQTKITEGLFGQEIFDAAREGYLNAVDRLASSILRGHFPEYEMKQDYRDFIAETVRMFPDEFRAGTRYRMVLRLYEKWQD